MGIPDHLTCPLTSLYVDQEATVGTLYRTTVWFKNEKGGQQGCLLSPCLFSLYSEHTMKNVELGELQATIKIGGRYTDDTTLMAESEEELKNLLMRLKESKKSVLKTKY